MENASKEIEMSSTFLPLQARKEEFKRILRRFFFSVLLMPDQVTVLECVKMTELMEELLA